MKWAQPEGFEHLSSCFGHAYNVLTMALFDRLTRPARYGVQLAGAAWPQFLRPLVLELASHRPIREVEPGIHHWTAIHPRLRLPVDSYYIEPARMVLDPMVPREGLEWFERERPPARSSSPTDTISAIASATRRRSAVRSVAARPACTSSSAARRSRGSRSGRSWRRGSSHTSWERSAPTTPRYTSRTPAAARSRFADGLARPRGGGLTFVPGFLMGDDPTPVRAGLRESLRRLLDLEFDNLLFAHGEPLIGGGKVALREFVAGG